MIASDQQAILPSKLRSILEWVRTDRIHGANDLAVKCLRELRSVMATADAIEKSCWLRLVKELVCCRDSMVPLKNLMQQLQQKFSVIPTATFCCEALTVLDEVIDYFSHVTAAVASYASELITDGSTVISISRSSAVLATLRLAKQSGKNFKVIQLASAPGNEGYIVACELDQLQIATELVTDAQAGLFMPRADLAIVGCDSWLSDHYFVNKAGTYPLALLAGTHSKPFWVLADHYKDSDRNHQNVVLEEMDPSELDAPSGDMISIRNIYFETIPCSLITGRVDERGRHCCAGL